MRHVSKAFSGVPVIRDVSFQVNRREVACIIGSSGSGKSTLLRRVNHLEAIDAGEIAVDGELMGYRRHGRGW